MNRPEPAAGFRPQPANGLADYVFYSRYARYDPERGRRETYAEAVQRVERMHRERFGSRLERRLAEGAGATPADPADRALLARMLGGAALGDVLARAFAAVAERRVLPSMRSLQFGGEAIRRHPARMFNCAFSPADRPAFFREFFYLLLAGTGCGFSVQRAHVGQLPVLPPRQGLPLRVERHAVADSIEGWADALDALVRAHYEGFAVAFDYSAIRPRGAPVVTAGGRAPGPEPLRRALGEVAATLAGAEGRRLRPVEIYDIGMFVARAVLSGGVRRSATICLFSPDDEEMMNAKTGAWLERHPQRTASNNSAVILRAAADHALFLTLLEAQKEYGEPGFYFSDHPDYGCNPCGETGLHPVLAGPLEEAEAARLRALGHDGPLPPAARLSGWQMCNLTTINGAAVRTADDLLAAAVHAAAIGTLQAAYTDIDYLGPVTRYLNERDALLGVSICGFMDRPALLLDPRLLERAARLGRATNELVARALGLRPAARVTCVKPEGTASLLLGAAAGIHPHPARRYFRRVQADRGDPVCQRFRAANPEMVEPSALRPATDDCLVFPVEAPAGAGLREQSGAVEFLERVRLVQKHWVLAGEAPGGRSPGLHHSVSHTCPVRGDEWAAVADAIWRHRADFTGVALLADDAAARYPQPPVAAAATAEEAALWNRLACRPVDYTTLHDAPAGGAPLDVGACSAAACDIP